MHSSYAFLILLGLVCFSLVSAIPSPNPPWALRRRQDGGDYYAQPSDGYSPAYPTGENPSTPDYPYPTGGYADPTGGYPEPTGTGSYPSPTGTEGYPSPTEVYTYDAIKYKRFYFNQ